MSSTTLHQKGFSLIELLVAIGILSVLIGITLIAVNPAKQFGQANDTKRATDTLAILNALSQFLVDPVNAGSLPGGLNASICPVGAPCTIANDPAVTPRVDICAALVTEYIAALPQDPSFNGGESIDCSGTYNTHYLVEVGAAPDNRITVTAPAGNTYSGIAISVTR
jgi:prepilin-type N-terminal cleavage/methylation domain-containing protein